MMFRASNTAAENKEVQREVGYIFFKIFHVAFLFVALMIIGLFVYEQNVVTFDDKISLVTAIPTESEYEGDEQIKLIIFADVESRKMLQLDMKLICDFGDGDGYSAVSSDSVSLSVEPREEDFSRIQTLSNSSENGLPFSQISEKLRTINKTSNLGDIVVFSGSLPRETSQCFVDITAKSNTKFFNIEKTEDAISYPFDYVWYFDPDAAWSVIPSDEDLD